VGAVPCRTFAAASTSSGLSSEADQSRASTLASFLRPSSLHRVGSPLMASGYTLCLSGGSSQRRRSSSSCTRHSRNTSDADARHSTDTRLQTSGYTLRSDEHTTLAIKMNAHSIDKHVSNQHSSTAPHLTASDGCFPVVHWPHATSDTGRRYRLCFELAIDSSVGTVHRSLFLPCACRDKAGHNAIDEYCVAAIQ
jgi:hypothetical protein